MERICVQLKFIINLENVVSDIWIYSDEYEFIFKFVYIIIVYLYVKFWVCELDLSKNVRNYAEKLLS